LAAHRLSLGHRHRCVDGHCRRAVRRPRSVIGVIVDFGSVIIVDVVHQLVVVGVEVWGRCRLRLVAGVVGVQLIVMFVGAGAAALLAV